MKKDGKKRVWFLLIFCTAVFAAFLVRLYWMQFTMADHYAKKLEQASQTSYTVRIPAARGSIVDRSGTALVQDDTVYDLALCVPAPPDTEMAQTLQTLKELDLGGKDVETQLAAFCSAVSAGELPLAENLTQAQCQSLLAAGLPQSAGGAADCPRYPHGGGWYPRSAAAGRRGGHECRAVGTEKGPRPCHG